MATLRSPARPTLIRTRIARITQLLEEIHEFEAVIEKAPGWDLVPGLRPIEPLNLTARLFAFLGGHVERWMGRWAPAQVRKDYLSVGYLAPHYLIYKSLPYFLFQGGLRMVWIYDSWENNWPQIERLFRSWRINLAFFSSRQTTEHFNGLGIPNFQAHWVPEAVTVAVHRAEPWEQRRIDVLQLGRCWDDYHEKIQPICRRKGWNYLYEQVKGELIFPTRRAFIDGLANAKISICVPSSITHPARSGRIETMTWRYLQSMASKCLVLGRMPDEMKALFDYSPMIEIDLENPGEQLADILANFSSYQPLIERNYAFVQQHHQWPNRLAEIERVWRRNC